MTKEEAIAYFKDMNECTYGDVEPIQMAIKTLEQETVSKEVYDHEYFLRKELELKTDKLQRQLDEIRAEINSPNRGTCDYFIVDRIEEIINKYKEESEEKE